MTFRQFLFTTGAAACAASALWALRHEPAGVAGIDFVFAAVFIRRGWGAQ